MYNMSLFAVTGREHLGVGGHHARKKAVVTIRPLHHRCHAQPRRCHIVRQGHIVYLFHSNFGRAPTNLCARGGSEIVEVDKAFVQETKTGWKWWCLKIRHHSVGRVAETAVVFIRRAQRVRVTAV